MLKRRAPATVAKSAARQPTPKRATGAPVGVPRFAASSGTQPAISRRSDRWEAEARQVSARAVRHAEPAPASGSPPARSAPRAATAPRATRAAPPAARAAPRAPRPARTIPPATGPPPTSASVRSLPEPLGLDATSDLTQPLSPALRRRLEDLLVTDLSAVRLHRGPAAGAAAERLQARAFTVGNHIYLRAGESPDDVALIAHETAHAVQQTATLHAADPRGPPLAAITPAPLALTPAPPGVIQRDSDDDSLVPDFLSDAAGAVGGAVVEGFWYAVDTFAPDELSDLLHQVRDEGFWGILKRKISAAIDFVFAELKNQGGTTAQIAGIFEKLLDQAKPILAALGGGDCEPLIQGVKDLGDTLGQMAGDAWEQITDFLRPIGTWCADVWENFGAPAVTFLTNFASATWEWIQGLGDFLWDLSSPVRRVYSGAWTEIKNLLGFGGGNDDDGSGGLVGWIEGKADEVWDSLKAELDPVLGPVQEAAETIQAFLPLNIIHTLRENISEWVEQATVMADSMDEPNDVADNQDVLRDVIIPGIQEAIGTLRGHVTSASNWVIDAIGGLVTKVTGVISSVASVSLLAPFESALAWLSQEAEELGQWATGKVAVLFAYVDFALATLSLWITPIFEMLKKLFSALGDLMGLLADVVLGPLLLVPQCIRDPIKDFIVTRILSQIPVFSQLVELPAIWAKVEPAFQTAMVQVFRDGNLFGAAWTFFKTILVLLDVPPQLVTNVIRNAAKAVGDVIKSPIRFLRNLLGAMKAGLLQFVDRIGTHLLNGAMDWLLSGVKDAGVKIPEPFALTLRNVLDLVLQVLQLTQEKILQRIDKLHPAAGKVIRGILAAGGKILEWIDVLVREGPAGLWKFLKGQLSTLWDTLLGMVIDYLVGKIVQQATIWVTKTLASGGLSVILDAIKAVYDALQVMKQYLQRLLEVVNSVCNGIVDIAKGVLNKAADMVEDTAARLVPVVLAFLARTLGIGDLPIVIGEGIQKVRQVVEDAIDLLIEKTVKGIDWAKQKGRDAVAALLEWWKHRKGFTNADGESHTLSFRGGRENAALTVESTPRPLVTFLATYEADKKPDAAEKEIIRQIRTKVTKLENIKSKDGTRNRSSFTVEDGEQIRLLFLDIVALLGKLRGDGAPPATKVAWTAPEEDGVRMQAEPLSLNPGPYAGSQPNQESKLWVKTSTRYPGKYVRGHLLNHHVHGPGAKQNLTPITIGANNRMERLVETHVKNAVLDEKKTLRFVVHVSSFHAKVSGFPEAAKLPAQIQMKAEEITRQGSGWKSVRTVVNEPIASPLPT